MERMGNCGCNICWESEGFAEPLLLASMARREPCPARIKNGSRHFLKLLVLAVAALCAASLQAADATREVAKGGLLRLQGSWKLVDFSYYSGGQRRVPEPMPKEGLLTFTANRYRLKLHLGDVKVDRLYTIKLHPSQDQQAWDVILPTGQLIQGICEVKGNTLRRCFSQPGAPRPTMFQQGDQTYQEWRRIDEENE